MQNSKTQTSTLSQSSVVPVGIPNPNTPMNKTHKPTKLILVIITQLVLVGSVAIGAFLFGLRYPSLHPSSRTSQGPLEPTPTADPLESWKKFQVGSLSFKIPPDWHPSEDKTGESGIILVTNNLEYVNFADVKAGALLYVPITPVNESLLDTILSENIKRGYTLLSDQRTSLNGIEARQITIESPLGAVEIQIRFNTLDAKPTFISIVTSKSESNLRQSQLELMARTFESQEPVSTIHFVHPDNVFELDFPATMTFTRTDDTSGYQRPRETWTFSSSSSEVTLVLDPFQRLSVEEEVRDRYQTSVLAKNNVVDPLKRVALSGRTAYTYVEKLGDKDHKAVFYFPTSKRDYLLYVSYIQSEQTSPIAAGLLSSLQIN